jgi:hypothetical protein
MFAPVLAQEYEAQVLCLASCTLLFIVFQQIINKPVAIRMSAITDINKSQFVTGISKNHQPK